jgi:hypothetical protein
MAAVIAASSTDRGVEAQRRPSKPATMSDPANPMTHFEVCGRDPAALADFYEKLLRPASTMANCDRVGRLDRRRNYLSAAGNPAWLALLRSRQFVG